MNNSYFFIIPLMTALSGWVIARIFFKLCFHPREPRTILGFRLQGIFPKLKKDMPGYLAEMLGKESGSPGGFSESWSDPENLKPVLPLIENHIDDFLRNKLAIDIPMVAMFVGDKTIGLLKQSFLREMQLLFPEVMKEYAAGLKTQVNLKEIVENKMKIISDQLEAKLEKDLYKQFISISLVGVLVGLLSGLLIIGLLAIL